MNISRRKINKRTARLHGTLNTNLRSTGTAVWSERRTSSEQTLKYLENCFRLQVHDETHDHNQTSWRH